MADENDDVIPEAARRLLSTVVNQSAEAGFQAGMFLGLDAALSGLLNQPCITGETNADSLRFTGKLNTEAAEWALTVCAGVRQAIRQQDWWEGDR